MALYEVAQQTKKTLKIGIALISLLIVFKISWNIWEVIKIRVNPPTLPTPEVCYGKIPKLKLNALPIKEGSNPTYRIDTVTGSFPPLPDRAPVYELKEAQATISVERAAEKFAKNLGFTGSQKEESAINWLWEDKTNGRTLRMNIVTGDFELDTNLRKLAPKIRGVSAPSQANVIDMAKNFLIKNNLLNGSLASGEQKIQYARISGNRFSLVEDKTDAQIVEVNFFVNLPVFSEDYPGFNAESLPQTFSVLNEKPVSGLVQVYVTGGKKEIERFPKVSYKRLLVDDENRCTYPLKTISTAWEELNSGQGTIVHLELVDSDPYANYTPLDIAEFQIREIRLAYLEIGQLNKKYLQPVFVFEGEARTARSERARHIIYIPAVDSHCQGERNDLGTPCKQ